MIRAITSETGAQIDIDDEGAVSISSMTDTEVSSAVEKIEALTHDPQAGEKYEGEVKRIQPFGAFVEILPGKEGLVHISDMSEDFVKDPGDVVKIGDKVKVRVKEVDEMGRLNLSMLLSGDKKRPRSRPRESKPRTFDRGRRTMRPRWTRQSGPRRRSSGGPHFPKSRLLDQYKKDFSR